MALAYDFEVLDIQGKTISLEDFKGHVLLVINTASSCGFTPQLKGLQNLHETYAEKGLVVLGFPCNQFGAQDAGSDEEIHIFCKKNYGVSFPMMAKSEVNGEGAAPLFKWLKSQAPGLLRSEGIKWNFTKFLIGKDGQVLRRYGSNDSPESLIKDIEVALKAA
tara:strand:+ start:1306 stop:1794 length:489 start_codon:yes stop_codon:yes gene_type:complete